jgi:hypothetical protein
LSNLKDFLKKQAEQERDDAERREAVLQDWLRSLNELMSRLKGWLQEADPENVLTILERQCSIRERRLGVYWTPALEINLRSHAIRINPVARYAIGSTIGDAFGTTIRDGRVDMFNVDKKYMLYRRHDEGRDEWLMVDDRTYQSLPLTQPNFDAAVQSMLE